MRGDLAGGTARLDARFADRQSQGGSAFVTFVMAGDPDHETSLGIVRGLAEAGADVIELGMPFTDPMADGPAIQAAGLRALAAGADMRRTLDLVREFRADDRETPIVLMGYFNPIHYYGVEAFLDDAKAAGVDGLIVVDLPPEEDAELCLPALEAGLSFIRLATPTTDDRRHDKTAAMCTEASTKAWPVGLSSGARCRRAADAAARSKKKSAAGARAAGHMGGACFAPSTPAHPHTSGLTSEAPPRQGLVQVHHRGE